MPQLNSGRSMLLAEACGPLVVLLERLGGRGGEVWLEWLVKFNQKETPWSERDGDSIRGIDRSAGSDPEARMLRAKDAARYLGVSPSTLAKWRLSGGTPPFYKFGSSVLYDRAEVDKWLSTKRRRSTSDPGETSKTKTR